MIVPAHLESTRRSNRLHLIMTVLMVGYGVGYMLCGEIVPAGGGFGWDGVIYADMTRRLDEMVAHGQFSNYYAKRLLPAAAARLMLLATGAEFTNTNIIRAFQILNIALIAASSWIWKYLADHFHVSDRGRCIGFAGLFVNFLVCKQILYAPVTTDGMALFMNLLMTWCYVDRRPWLLFATTLLGSFVWQLTGISGAILLLTLNMTYPDTTRETSFVDRLEARYSRAGLWARWGACLLACVASYLILHGVCGTKHRSVQRFVTNLPTILVIAAAVSLLIVTPKILRPLAAQWRRIGVRNALLAFAGLVIPWLMVRSITDPDLPNASNAGNVVKWAVCPFGSEGKFLIAFVTLTLVWGPAVMLLGLLWRPVAAKLRHLGPGAVGLVALTLPLALPTEPRFVLGAWPLAVLALVLALEERRTARAFVIAFATLTVLLAKFWLPLNIAPWTGADDEGLLSFPKQMVFMHYGPWINSTMYALQAIGITLAGFWLHATVESRTPGPKRRAPAGPMTGSHPVV